MIYTLTPNPVLDLGGVVEQIIPNEKVYVHHETRSPGGNSINVARILRRMKVPVVATGFLGGGVGEEVRELLENEKVRNQFVSIKGATRVNITVSDQKSHLQTRLSFAGPKISAAEKEKLFRQIQKLRAEDFLVCGGSFPPGFSTADLIKILKICERKKIPVVLDCPAEILKRTLDYRPVLIKPNLLEFQELTGRKIHSLKSVVDEARRLSHKVPWVCVSSVEGGTLLVTNDEVWFGKIPKVQIKSTVGAGDSMVALMSLEIEKARKLQKNPVASEVLKWGLASAAASLSHSGTAFGEAPEIQALYHRAKVHPL